MAFSFTFENTIPKANLIPVQYWSRGEKFLTKDNEILLVIWKFQSREANPYSVVFTLVPRAGNACLSPLSVGKRKTKDDSDREKDIGQHPVTLGSSQLCSLTGLLRAKNKGFRQLRPNYMHHPVPWGLEIIKYPLVTIFEDVFWKLLSKKEKKKN